ncbi:MAG: hypothetical protein ACOYXW_03350 [Actinomycetota bacterium]|nr:hypothetical protein HJG43_06960 [Kineosporiaceae bacterium SCSIO 59966]
MAAKVHDGHQAHEREGHDGAARNAGEPQDDTDTGDGQVQPQSGLARGHVVLLRWTTAA